MPRASRQVSNSNKRTSKIAAEMRGEMSSFSSASKGLILRLDGTHLDGGIPTPLKNVPNHQPATNRKWLKQNKKWMKSRPYWDRGFILLFVRFQARWHKSSSTIQ